MDLNLNDKRALVTASTAGIGRAIAEELLREGAHVTVNGRTEESVARAIKELSEKYPSVKGITADLGRASGCQYLISEIKEPIDILINNYGTYELVDFFDSTDDEWLEIYENNVLSGVRLSRYYLPRMLHKGWGRILFISSESGLNIPKEMIHYGVTKTAQLAVMRGLAKLTKGTDITVNALLPGPTKTRGVMEFMQQIANREGISMEEVEKNFVKEHRPSSLNQRFANSEEVAHMAVFLCSPMSSATNGSSVKVEGGIVDQIM
ncbi:MAG: SDR family oxidoreductase [Chlamydiales bacterium]